jgi:sigma-B regulation protein RsbU (phosphoserine phosphatase)
MDSKSADIERLSGQLGELRQQLQLKNLQLDAVLQLTQAINYNFSNAALFEIYGYVLQSELKVGRYLLFLEEQHWVRYGSKGLDLMNYPTDVSLIEGRKKIARLEGNLAIFFPGFELLIPVIYKDRLLAFVLLGDITWPQGVEKELMQYIQAVTNILAVANENRKLLQQQFQQEKMQQELALAAQMQGLLIPDSLPHDKQVEMSAVYLPHRDVGGDYYDVIKLKKEELLFCVADVSGKGIPAALLMANFQANLRALAPYHLSLRDLVPALNKAVLNITKGDKFITMFIGKLDEEQGLLKYISAGHVPPLLLRKNEVIELKEGTTILGMFDELPFLNVGRHQLEPGDVILAFTDGLSEVTDYKGRSFGLDQLQQTVVAGGHQRLKELNKAILQQLMAFKGDRNFSDDLTLLSLRFRA